jgi:hypothetical protein
MTEISERGVDHATAVPASAWAFAWSFVAGQVLELARRGAQSPDDWPLSMLFGVALVTFFSHGVLRARWVRFWLVVVLVAVALVAELVAFVDAPTGWTAAALALSVLQAVLLHRYTCSTWFELQRARVPGAVSLNPILLVAALVGALGGILGAEQSLTPTQEMYEDPFSDPFTDPAGDPFVGLE